MTTLIFANGDIESLEWIHPYIIDATLIIAADGGSRYLFALEKHPHVTIGDLDSVSSEVKRWLMSGDTQLIQFPTEKNETDLELALIHAVQHGDDPILVFGASGGRLDQAMANLMLLVYPEWIDRDVRLVEEHQQAWVTCGTAHIEGRIGDTVSLIPLGGDVQIANTAHLKWPLQDSTLKWGYARGISNVLTASAATVTVASGTLLCVWLDRDWQR